MTRDAPAVFNRAEWSLPALPANTPFVISFEYLFSPSTVTTTSGAVATQLGFSDADPAVRLSAFNDFRTIEGAGYRFGYNQYGSRVLFTYDSGTSQAVLASVSASLAANAWYTFGLGFNGANTWTYSVAPSSSLANVASGSVIDANVGTNIRSSAFGNRVRMLADTGTFCSQQTIRNFSFQILTPYVDTTVAGNTWQMLSSAKDTVMLSANGTTGTVTANDIAVSSARVRYGQANEKTLTTTAFTNVLLYGSTFNTPANVASTGSLRLTNGTTNQVQTVQYPASGLTVGSPFAISCDYVFVGTGDGFCMQAFASDTGTAAPFAFSGFSTIANAGFRFGYTIFGGQAQFGYSDASATTILASNVIALSNNTTYRCTWTFDGVQTWTYAMSTGGNAVVSGTVANASTLGNMTRALYPSVVRFRASSGSATADQWVSNVQITYGLQCADTVFTGNSWQLRLGNGLPVVVVNTTAAGGGLGTSIAGSLSATSANLTGNASVLGSVTALTSMVVGNTAGNTLGNTAGNVLGVYGAFTTPTSITAVSVSESNAVTSNVAAVLFGNTSISSSSNFDGYGSVALALAPQTYVEIPSLRGLAWPSRAFTMECWVYPTTHSAGTVYVIGQYFGNVGVHGLSIGFSGGVPYVRYFGSGNDTSLAGNTAVSLNQWHHLAFCSEAVVANVANAYLFLDGVRQTVTGPGSQGTYLTLAGPRSFEYPFLIGGTPGTTAATPALSIQGARVLLGNMAYTTSFTPGLLTKGPSTANTALLLTVPNAVSGMTVSGAGVVSVTGDLAVSNNATITTANIASAFMGTSRVANSIIATANIATANINIATANALTVGGLVVHTSSADYNYARLGGAPVYYRATTAQTSAGVSSAIAVAIAGDVPHTAVSRVPADANVGSLFFRGKGSYVTVPGMSYANTPAFATNEYTMECYVNFPGNSTVNNVTYLMGTFDPIVGSHFLSMFAFNGSLNCRYRSSTITPGSQTFYSNSKSIKANTWHHCALTLTGTTANTGVMRLFLDGVAQELMYNGTTSQGFSTPKVNMLAGTTVPFTIAQDANAAYDPFYLDSARVLLGNAAYTTNFTPPANLTYGPAGVTTLLLANVRRGSPDMQISSFGNVSINAPVAILASPATFLPNGQMTFSLLNNTTLAIQARGTDGVLRSGNITLA